MIKTLTSYTFEIDEPELAAQEIFEQLDLESNLLSHSVGILTCYAEFIDTEVVRTICRQAPFDIVGCTSIANASKGELGHLMLALTVLTSDDVVFSSAVTDSLSEDQEAPLRDAYAKALAKLGGEPTMMITFAPLISHVGGERLVRLLDGISGGVPNFGTVSMDHTVDYAFAQTIYNGESSKENLSMVLLSGDVAPSFFIASISEEKVQKQKAIITKSEGNVLHEVNDMPIIEYMRTLGLTKNNGIESAVTIPLIIDYNDGTKPVARAIYTITDEGAICGGDMPVNSTLAIGFIDTQDVLTTTGRTLKEALDIGKANGLLMATCLCRTLVLGAETTAEMEVVRDIIGNTLPYQLFYSGGEICPVYDESGKAVNRFHNNTFAACIF